MTDAYDRNKQMIRAEVAAEVLNNVRGIIMGRIYEVEAEHPEEAKRLNTIESEVFRKQRAIDFQKPEEVEAVIDEWGPLLKDMDAFWRRING